ncbi:hypothetical protein [Sphingobacterium thalpophilum]|uniref:Uncharacterized protein n=2 Tax=Sphingobacterium thalpophilum TaxID=259 RepID=A0A4V6KR94_9SPHI|nr:hypothetical protein [Sphingobacterium thalpophilum]VTR41908.1 Uncharacterised protein [Sphingobacterium thalpophilum]
MIVNNMEDIQIDRKKIEQWISEGYDVIQDGKLLKVDGNLQEFLAQFADEEESKTYLLQELITWPEEELKKL